MEFLLEREYFVFTGGNTAKSDLDHWVIQTFVKAQKTFGKYWTLTKIKIGLTCVYKEKKYEVQKKTVQQELLQLKMKFLLG